MWIELDLANIVFVFDPATDQIVAVTRHGEKDKNAPDGDALTEKGREQICAQVRFIGALLTSRGISRPSFVIGTGAVRTRQAGQEAIEVLELPLEVEEREGFHFQPAVDEAGYSSKRVMDEAKEIAAAGGKLSHALAMSTYAPIGRQYLTDAILDLADQMDQAGEHSALVFSHSPYAELAAVNADEVPYCLGEGDTVLYIVRGGHTIIDSVHIPGQLGGETNVTAK